MEGGYGHFVVMMKMPKLLMNRSIYSVIKKTWGFINYTRLKIGFYKRETLPKFNFDSLTEKWTYAKPRCLIEGCQCSAHSEVDLSICIPMYNVEQYIYRLLLQIERQETSYTYEVILVDDGSTDETGTIVKRFVEGKANYQLYSQTNKGISAARNKAIEKATGRYLTFIDSDDEMCVGFIEKLMSAAIAHNADIVRGNYSLKRGDTLINRGVSSGYIWGSIIRNSLFFRIRFPEGYWYEDMINPFLIEPQANVITYISDIVIYHNDVKGSASKQQSHSKNYKALEHLYLVMSLTEDYKILGFDKSYLHKRLVAECSSLMVERTALLDEETRKQVFLACNWLFENNGVDPSTFLGLDFMYALAITNKDYAAWKLVAMVQNSGIMNVR